MRFVRGAAMDPAVGTYYALYFEDIASAVEYCQSLVRHIVPRPGASPTGEERSVVWFHVPRRSSGTSHEGCYLFASAGALAAARRGGLATPMSEGRPAPEPERAPHYSHSTSKVGDGSR